MSIKDMLFSFKGRIRRRDWWLWSILAGVASSIGFLLLGGLLFGWTWASNQYGTAPIIPRWPTTLFGVVTIAPLLWVQSALAAKRAHDRNSGALISIGVTVLCTSLSFVPEVADLTLGYALDDAQFAKLAYGVALAYGAMGLYLLVVLGFLDGTKGPNRFGSSPKGIGGDTAEQAAEVFS